MPTYLEELKTRAVAIEKEWFLTLTPPKSVDSVPYFFFTGEDHPYLTHRITGLPIDHSDSNENEEFPLPRLIIRCVIGHITGAYSGENDNIIDVYIPGLTHYFSERKWFQSAAYPTPPDYLERSEVVDAGGFMVFDNRGFAGVQQVGFEITIACVFTEFVQQVYL